MSKNPGSGFFDKLIASDTGRVISRSSKISLTDTIASVKKNIERILNSRKGCSLSCPDLGLDDFNDAGVGSVDMLVHIAQDIKISIDKYEPRVEVDSVTHIPSDHDQLNIGFRINCHVMANNKQEEAEIELMLDNSNLKFRVH